MSRGLRFNSLSDLGKGAWRISPGQEVPAAPQPITPPTAPPAPEKKRTGRSKKRDLEGEEQCALVLWFREAYPDIGKLLIAIPNGGYRKSAFEGWRLKQQGVKAGVSDLFLPVARQGYHGLWIEFKATPPYDAPVTVEQKEWLDLMRAQGYRAEVGLGFDAAKAVLVAYLAGAQPLDV